MRRTGSHKIKMVSNLPMRNILRKRGSTLIETDTGETPVDILNAESGASFEAAEAKALEAESAIDIEDRYVKEPSGADVKESAYVVNKMPM